MLLITSNIGIVLLVSGLVPLPFEIKLEDPSQRYPALNIRSGAREIISDNNDYLNGFGMQVSNRGRKNTNPQQVVEANTIRNVPDSAKPAKRTGPHKLSENHNSYQQRLDQLFNPSMYIREDNIQSDMSSDTAAVDDSPSNYGDGPVDKYVRNDSERKTTPSSYHLTHDTPRRHHKNRQSHENVINSSNQLTSNTSSLSQQQSYEDNHQYGGQEKYIPQYYEDQTHDSQHSQHRSRTHRPAHEHRRSHREEANHDAKDNSNERSHSNNCSHNNNNTEYIGDHNNSNDDHYLNTSAHHDRNRLGGSNGEEESRNQLSRVRRHHHKYRNGCRRHHHKHHPHHSAERDYMPDSLQYIDISS